MSKPVSAATVLVVEDDAATRQLLKVLLGTVFHVDCAVDGAEALDRVVSRSYAAILLDLKMPGVDGFEVLRQLMVSAPGVLQRVIVLTALPPNARDLREFSAPVFRLMRKPFEIPDLLRTVRECASADA